MMNVCQVAWFETDFPAGVRPMFKERVEARWVQIRLDVSCSLMIADEHEIPERCCCETVAVAEVTFGQFDISFSSTCILPQ